MGGEYHVKNVQQATVSNLDNAIMVDNLNSQQRRVLLKDTSLTVNRTWRLSSLAAFDGLETIEHRNNPFITISESGVVGFSGCNRFFSDNVRLFESTFAHKSLFEIGNMAITRAMCQHKSTQQLEKALFTMLENSNRLYVEWPFLSFYKDDITVAQFVASDWD